MTDQPPSPKGSFAPTLDIPRADAEQPLEKRCAQLAFPERSSAHLSGEIQSVLRDRLRAAALIMTFGSGLFLIWGFVAHPVANSAAWGLRGFHAVVVAVLAAHAFFLCRQCSVCLRNLRMAELVIFGLPAAFFAASQGYRLLHWQEMADKGMQSNPTGAWVALMYTYAIFIPNTWKRAALVVGSIGMTPILVMLVLSGMYMEVRLHLTPEHLTGWALMMIFVVASASYGSQVISRLRVEAFEAKRLGQYRLRELLGTGGMGEVYLAEHELLKRPCAVKVIRPSKAHDWKALARFEREVHATAALSHWNTVEIFDYGVTEDGTFYYVMEFLPGMSLQELVDAHGPLPPARAIHFLRQTSDALREAHSRGLIHRDVKPGNIFSAERGGVYDVAKLLDFGLVKEVSAEESSSQLTQEQSITGSPRYLSPEQALGDQPPDERSDVYSLGATAYFLLTGRPPFESDRAIKIILAHAHDEPEPPSRWRPELPKDLEQVILRCLAKRPEDRYQRAEELEQALADCESAADWTRQDAADWWEASAARRPDPVVADAPAS
ncbi:MAG: serine/threonine protein kinase [Planctomycetales bacterium]